MENKTILDIIKETKLDKVYVSLKACYGNIIKAVNPTYIDVNIDNMIFIFNKDGSYFSNGECMIFPSKEERDWNKWYENWKKEHTPKTWNELYPSEDIFIINQKFNKCGSFNAITAPTITMSPKEKSAIAYLKILYLIDKCYGGLISREDWNNPNVNKYCIECTDYQSVIHHYIATINNIAFYSRKLAEEFLSYSENVQLIKDYYMIND